MDSLNADVVAVSDVHVVDPSDERAKNLELLINFLTVSDVKVFLLVGDIFDFILGTNKYFDKRFKRISLALSKLAESGTRIVFLEGNHEFKSQKLAWEGVEYLEEGTLFLKEFNLIATHGDLIKSPPKYFYFRRFIRSRFVTSLASIVPGSLLNKLALYLSGVSRSTEDYNSIPVQEIADAIKSWQESFGAKFAVCGHFHIPYADQSKAGTFYCMKWWGQEPNALVLNEGKMQRLFWSNNSFNLQDTTKVLED